MDRLVSENHRAVILDSLKSYLDDVDRRYASPYCTVSEQECERANYVQEIIDTMMGLRQPATEGLPEQKPKRHVSHKMIAVSLDCILKYQRKVSDDRSQINDSNLSQQNAMYNHRLLRQRVDNTFWELSKPFMSSLSVDQVATVKRVTGRFSPKEVVEIALSHENLLEGTDVEQQILDDADEMNGGHQDKYLAKHQSKHLFKRLFHKFEHKEG